MGHLVSRFSSVVLTHCSFIIMFSVVHTHAKPYDTLSDGKRNNNSRSWNDDDKGCCGFMVVLSLHAKRIPSSARHPPTASSFHSFDGGERRCLFAFSLCCQFPKARFERRTVHLRVLLPNIARTHGVCSIRQRFAAQHIYI